MMCSETTEQEDYESYLAERIWSEGWLEAFRYQSDDDLDSAFGEGFLEAYIGLKKATDRVQKFVNVFLEKHPL